MSIVKIISKILIKIDFTGYAEKFTREDFQMTLKKILFAGVTALVLSNVGFAAAAGVAGDREVLTESKAQTKALKEHSPNTGLTSVEAWFTKMGALKRKTGNELLVVHNNLEKALKAFAQFKAKEIGIACAGEETELAGTIDEAFDTLVRASMASIFAGDPRGSTIYILCADYLTKKGKPDAFAVLYKKLTDAANAFLDSTPGIDDSARAFTQTMLSEHNDDMAGKDTDHRLLHMALKGSTIAGSYLWKTVTWGPEWFSSWSMFGDYQRNLIIDLSAQGCADFQGLYASSIFKDTTLPLADRRARLQELKEKGYIPAVSYLAALYLAEMDAEPSKMDDEKSWETLLDLSNKSIYARETMANILTGAGDPVTGKQRMATPAFLNVMRAAASQPETATPYQVLLALAQSRNQDEWYQMAALRIFLGEDEWKDATPEARWAILEALQSENPSVGNLMVTALNSTDFKMSMGWSTKTPDERRIKLGELINVYQNVQARELFLQAMIGSLNGAPYKFVPGHLGIRDFAPTINSDVLLLSDKVPAIEPGGSIIASDVIAPRLGLILQIATEGASKSAQQFLLPKPGNFGGLAWWFARKQVEADGVMRSFEDARTRALVYMRENATTPPTQGIFAAGASSMGTAETSMKLGLYTDLSKRVSESPLMVDWSFIFNIANVLNLANDGKATRYGIGPDFR